jgi:hypothetical protein
MTFDMNRPALKRAGWDIKSLTDEQVRMCGEVFKWAMSNPLSRDLNGNAETFFNWKYKKNDPHL